MLRRLQSYSAMQLLTTSGEDIGTVQDFYVDDEHWKVRYLAVASAPGLPGPQLLIAPQALADADGRKGHAALSHRSLASAPGFDPSRQFPRAAEEDLARHFGWPAYWKEVPAPPSSYTDNSGGVTTRMAQRTATRLFATGRLIGMRCIASDGDAGSIEDFIFDDASWEVRWLVINVGPTALEKRALVSPRWIVRLDEGRGAVHVNLAQELIAESPDYEPGMPLDQRFERQLCEHYGMPKNWC